MEPSQLILNFFDSLNRSLILGEVEVMDCPLDEFCDYLRRTEFDRTSLGAYLKNKLETLLHDSFVEQDSYKQFMKSSAFQLLNNVWFNREEFSNKVSFIKNVKRYISLAIVEQTYDDVSEDKAISMLLGKSDDLYIKDNNQLHQLILGFSATAPETIQSICTKESLEQKNWGNTPLVLACKTGNTLFALELIKQHQTLNADINAADSFGMTALHWACFFRDDSLILALLEAGANISSLNNKNKMPLDFYQYEMPIGMRIDRRDGGATAFCHLPKIAAITDGSNKFFSIQAQKSTELADCIVDILFHMDQIAKNQLDVRPSMLVAELGRAKYNSTVSNSSFEIFTYYHFENFVWARNRKLCAPAIIDRLKINGAAEKKPNVAVEEQQQQLYGLLSDLQVVTHNSVVNSAIDAEAQSQLLTQQSQLDATLKQLCKNQSNDGVEQAIKHTKQFDHQLEAHPDVWSKVHPVLKAILGILSLMIVIPAIIVEIKSSHGYINTFFGKDSKNEQTVSPSAENGTDLGSKGPT